MRNRIIAVTLTASACVASLLGQDVTPSPASPVLVKRLPPTASQKKSGNPSLPLVLNYDVGVQLQALGNGDALAPVANASVPAALADSPGKAPGDYRPKKDVLLNPTALGAVRVS